MSDRSIFGDLRERVVSFRARLRLFFVLVVIIPMIAVTLVVFSLISASEKGQADARVGARQDAAISLYNDRHAQADRLAERIGRDLRLAAALRSGDASAIKRVAADEVAQTDAQRIVLRRGTRVLVDEGSPTATLPATRELVEGGRTLAQLQVSVVDAGTFARLVRTVTHLETVVATDDKVVGATLAGAAGLRLPNARGIVRVSGQSYRAATFDVPGFGDSRVQIAVLRSESTTAAAIRRGRLLAGLVLAGFFLFALMGAIIVSRALQGQIETFLAAARRLGGGDFSAEVPTRGRDEFAQLGEEFNKMSRQLSGRLGELGQERLRMELSLRRIGETFASNLDRDGLLEIVVRTAIDAVNAEGGHARLVGSNDPFELDGEGGLQLITEVGDPALWAGAVEEVERRVLAIGEPSFANLDGAHALAHPLRAGPAAGAAADHVTGLITVWRGEQPFTHRERELFHYLAGQAAVSVENVGLHETVERQAVTDELTGLSNRRRFQDTLVAEVERAKRFDQELGLVLLDIDDFKAVNDTYGHQQGDLVLKEVGRILRESSREIDEPARYGGEELAVVLPSTDLVGAFNLAERVRVGIEALRLPVLGDEDAEPLRITASFGAAAMPVSAGDVRGLVAAADGALYDAKRAGKNQTVSAS